MTPQNESSEQTLRRLFEESRIRRELIEQARREERERCVRICEEYAQEKDALTEGYVDDDLTLQGYWRALFSEKAARELARRIARGE